MILRRFVSGGLTRSSRYSSLTPADVEFFKSIDPSMVVTDKEELERYSVDWMKKYRSQGTQLALRPSCVDHVSRILRYCNERKLALVPQGGNTGLVGGSVPVFDEIVVSLARMNRVIRVDADTNTVQTEAGVILQQLEETLNEHNMTVPIDLGAKGSCHIGGNVATNAGGIHLLRYGNLHGAVLGMQCVLADGTILDLDSAMRKDNTGFDMKQLFIGSEGALGIITRLTLAVPPLPRSRALALLGCDSFDGVKQILRVAKEELGEVLSAYEMLDAKVVDVCEKECVGVKSPLQSRPNFYVLVEVAGSNVEHDQAKLGTFSERVLSEGLATDGTIAQDLQQMKQIWRIRESAPEGVLKMGGKPFKYDISLPLENYYDIVQEVTRRLGDKGVAVGYGHVGDCNLHLNVAIKDPVAVDLLEPFVWEYCKQHRGSISAEHGIGLQKVKKMSFSKSPEAIELMKRTKLMLDPNLILNPYKVIDVYQ